LLPFGYSRQELPAGNPLAMAAKQYRVSLQKEKTDVMRSRRLSPLQKKMASNPAAKRARNRKQSLSKSGKNHRQKMRGVKPRRTRIWCEGRFVQRGLDAQAN
jgi:hypothetical protein